MTMDDFKRGLEPTKLSPELQSLWHDARGEWEKAHTFVQDLDSKDAAWVHAYLHRKEGDTANALYWYRRAGKPEFIGELLQEWEEIVKTLLSKSK